MRCKKHSRRAFLRVMGGSLGDYRIVHVATHGFLNGSNPALSGLLLSRVDAKGQPRDGLVLDFFAGSGTAGAAALKLGRRFLLVDESPAAHDVMQRRFEGEQGVRFWAP